MIAWCERRERDALQGVRGGLLFVEPNQAGHLITGRTLVVCQNQSLPQWPCQVQKHRFVEADLCATTYETLIKTFAAHNLEKESQQSDVQGHRWRGPVSVGQVQDPNSLERLFRTDWQRIVFADAHRLCNRQSRAFAACMALRGAVRWAVSNNPMRRRGVDDLLGLFEVVGFRYRYANHHPFAQSYVRLGLQLLIWEQLCPVQQHWVRFDLNTEERQHYRQLLAEARDAPSWTAARRACITPDRWRWVQDFPHHALILTNHDLAAEAAEHDLHYCQHACDVEKALSQGSVMTSYGAYRHLTLLCDHLIFFDPWFTPQHGARHEWRLVASDTIEERVEDAALEKQMARDLALDGLR